MPFHAVNRSRLAETCQPKDKQFFSENIRRIFALAVPGKIRAHYASTVKREPTTTYETRPPAYNGHQFEVTFWAFIA